MAERRPTLPLSLITNPQSDAVRGVVRDLYGEVGLEYYEQIRTTPIRLEDRAFVLERRPVVDSVYFQRTRRRLGLTPGTEPQVFRDSNIAANDFVIGLHRELLSGYDDVSRLKNPVENCNYHPARVIEILADPNMDRVVKWEMKRKMLVAETAGYLALLVINEDIGRRVEEIGQHLDRNLYSRRARVAETFEYRIDAYHHRRTNLYIKPEDAKTMSPDSLVVREHVLQPRLVDGIGFVMTDMRTKTLDSAISKVLVKGLFSPNDSDNLHPLKDASDSAGIMFMVTGGVDMIRQVMDRAVGVLRNSPDGRASSVKPDNEILQTRGSSPAFKTFRLQVKMKGLSVRLELMFYDIEAHLNQRLHVGGVDTKTGLHTGSAHALYQLRRLGNLAEILFPKDFYPSLNVEQALATRGRAIVNSINRATNIVPVYRPDPRIDPRGEALYKESLAA